MNKKTETAANSPELELDLLAKQVIAARPDDHDPAWEVWSKTELAAFSRHTQHREFCSFDGAHLFYGMLEHPEPQAWVLVVPGRGEAYLKYQEVALDLVAAGFSVAMLDHRGQGHSDRMTAHPEQGHVNQFSDYLHDFAYWMEALREHIGSHFVHILAHSMGGTIATRFLQSKSHSVQSIVLNAPMFGLNAPYWHQKLAKPMTRMVGKFNRIFTPGRYWFAPGTGPWQGFAFPENRVTRSKQRYEHFMQLYADHPHVRIGGPSCHWVSEVLQAAEICIEQAARVEIPVLVLSSRADRVVASNKHQEFLAALTHADAHLQEIEGSEHEILMEIDACRSVALQAAIEFFRRQSR